jgi:hypothetical protein
MTTVFAECILHNKVDHLIDGDMLVERNVPLFHAILACLDDISAQLSSTHRAFFNFIQTFSTNAIVWMGVFAISPVVKYVVAIETNQTVYWIFLYLQAFLIQVYATASFL